MKTSNKHVALARDNKAARKAKGTAAAISKKPTAKANTPQQPQQTSANSPRDNSKLGRVIALLRAARGATIEELAKVTEWQAHSVRGAISGAVKKKLGLTVTSEKIDGVRTYRITD